MADEITLTFGLAVSNGAFRDSVPIMTSRYTQSDLGAYSAIVSVATSESDMAVGAVTTPGWLFLLNLDAAHFVTWGPKASGAMVACGKLAAGACAWVQLDPAMTLRWKADTAAVKVLVKLYQN